MSPQPVISIIGALHAPDELEIHSVFRLDAESDVPNGLALDMRAELVNAEGRVVASGTVYGLRSSARTAAAATVMTTTRSSRIRGWCKLLCLIAKWERCCGFSELVSPCGVAVPRRESPPFATRRRN